MCTQKLNMNIEFLNKHFSSSSSQKTRKTVLKSFKIDFKSIFPMKPSQFGNVCTKFELDPSNENRAIKKIRWVGQIRPGPLSNILNLPKLFPLLDFGLDNCNNLFWSFYLLLNKINIGVTYEIISNQFYTSHQCHCWIIRCMKYEVILSLVGNCSE